jgi:UDP-2,3-diacylglucosamine pyrophosphatase LpxH
MAKYRTGFISDLHLGTRGSNAAAVLHFLRDHEFDTLYLVGDLIDIWALRRGRYWPQAHNDVIQKILRKGRKGTKIIYIPGNHDEFVGDYLGDYGSISLVKDAVHVTADGRRIFVMHGHETDTVVQNQKWLAYIGDVGYTLLLRLNPVVHFFRQRLGLGYWSLSGYIKKSVKDAVNFIGSFETAIVRYAGEHAVDGVLCGHIHTPAVRQMGDITYYNCGDFVESCSAIVEHEDGRLELLTDLGAGIAELPEPDREDDEVEADAERPVAALG